MQDILDKIYGMTALGSIIDSPQFLIMYALAFLLLYLGIKKEFEPLVLGPADSERELGVSVWLCLLNPRALSPAGV